MVPGNRAYVIIAFHSSGKENAETVHARSFDLQTERRVP